MFKDRFEAGEKLADKLEDYKKTPNLVILAIPRGGVPVAEEIAKRLQTPLYVLVTRKLGAPGHEEFGIGAISEGNTIVLDDKLILQFGLTKEELSEVISREKKEMDRRIEVYRKGKPLPLLKGKTAILVDDGAARGVTALAGIKGVRRLKPQNLVFAAPVCSKEAAVEIGNKVDNLICLIYPRDMNSVGEFYEDFSEVTDEMVVNTLKKMVPLS